MNKVKTVLLLTLLTVFFIWLGNLAGGKAGATFAFFMAAIFNFGAYWYSDKIVLAFHRAEPLSESEAPEIHSILQELSTRAGIPKPRLYLVRSPQPNAFATGRDPAHSAVAVTEGILKLLDLRELRGVLAHEISHIKNRDTLISTVAATLAGAITYLAYMLRWVAIFGGFGGNDEDRGENFFTLLALSILAPLAALIIQMAISRAREYDADRTGAIISKDPLALASALRKLGLYTEKIPQKGNPAMSHLYIVNPFRGGISGLFSTHPPVEERIKRLEKMAREMGQI